MKDTNIELIEQARKHLELSQHEACFGKLDTFFKRIKVLHESPIHELYNHLSLLKTKYHRLMKEQREGIISYEQYDLYLTRISAALYAFFDSIIDENKQHVSNKNILKRLLHSDSIKIILSLNGNFNDFSKEEAIKVTVEIRDILGLADEKQFIYLNIESGSILINIKTVRNYELMIKLKSLAKLNIIDNLISIRCSDIILDRLCVALTNLELDLSGANLSGANLSRANLFEANLSKADLWRANLLQANLSRVDLSRVDLSRVDLSGADLSGADLSGADLSGADLSRVDLSRANLSGANLSGLNLSGLNLSGADLSGADLSKSNLLETKIVDIDFSQTKLHKTIFYTDQEIELMQMGADVSQCVFVDDFGKNVGASIHT